MRLDSTQRQVIKNCQKSCVYFLSNFCKVKHPNAGIIPLKPWSYQIHAIDSFKKNTFCIFKKTRQAGVSTISGAFALWLTMFHSAKTALVVSRTEDDAVQFLERNVKFVFDQLPPWMKEVWRPESNKNLDYNKHAVEFANKSTIRSKTSAPDVLRSNSSTLNIIDEAAFIPGMDAMWAAGLPTLSQGGRAIIISTTSGVGGWYYNTWVDAEARKNNFVPLVINWWDMDWVLEFDDELSGRRIRIAPRDGIRKCETQEDIEKYGPYWSPWLEVQYRQLQSRGEAWKFRQEILADFVGSGNTVVDQSVFSYVSTTINHEYMKVDGYQDYIHPISGKEEKIIFGESKEEGLYIWKKPDLGKRGQIIGNKTVGAISPHRYIMGVDIATGKGRDYSAVEIFDIDAQEQAAELMVHCLPSQFIKMVDWIGRYYNAALAIIERNNGGDDFIDRIKQEYMYPRLWRGKTMNDTPTRAKKSSPVKYNYTGHFTGEHTKPILNRLLIDLIQDRPEAGFTIYSPRLYGQLLTYVRKRDKLGHDTKKTEAEEGAFDDLVMATALAFLGLNDAAESDGGAILPFNMTDSVMHAQISSQESMKKFIAMGGQSLVVPIGAVEGSDLDDAIESQLGRFASQLGGIPVTNEGKPATTSRKHVLEVRK